MAPSPTRDFGSPAKALIRETLIRSNDANPVVSEFRVGSWNLIFRHMTGGAIFRAPWASCGGMAGLALCALSRNVATETAAVIGARVARKRLVRVVACEAGDTGVTLSPAPAQFKTVRLKAHRSDPYHAPLHDVGPGAMAGAAEVHGIDGIQHGGIQDMS